ncbi:hypothetical protein ABFS82_10G022800 [Erythranthe guttata]
MKRRRRELPSAANCFRFFDAPTAHAPPLPVMAAQPLTASVSSMHPTAHAPPLPVMAAQVSNRRSCPNSSSLNRHRHRAGARCRPEIAGLSLVLSRRFSGHHCRHDDLAAMVYLNHSYGFHGTIKFDSRRVGITR